MLTLASHAVASEEGDAHGIEHGKQCIAMRCSPKIFGQKCAACNACIFTPGPSTSKKSARSPTALELMNSQIETAGWGKLASWKLLNAQGSQHLNLVWALQAQLAHFVAKLCLAHALCTLTFRQNIPCLSSQSPPLRLMSMDLGVH